ncbi:MAG: pilus assembly protein [Elusimicrobiaceae bacterium]|nr:pilus assembly protein [Elusimicrobiaceae bacterium]
MRSNACRGGPGPKGQATVELLLVLPVFLMVIFLIMELGMLCYQMLLVNHAMYEVARICALSAGPKDARNGRRCDEKTGKANQLFGQMFGTSADGIIQFQQVTAICEPDGQQDGQNDVEYQDMVVEAKFKLKLFFPLTCHALGDCGHMTKDFDARLKMPVEYPVWCKNGTCV